MKLYKAPALSVRQLFLLCSIGMIWVSNIAPFMANNTSLLRFFIYPVHAMLIFAFISLYFKGKILCNEIDTVAQRLFWILIVLGFICVARGIPDNIDIDRYRTMLFSLSNAALIWFMPLSMLFAIKPDFWYEWLPVIRTAVLIGVIYVLCLMAINIWSHIHIESKIYNSTDLLFLSAPLLILSRYKQDSLNLILGFTGVTLLSVWMFLCNERFAIAYAGLMCLFYLMFFIGTRYRLDLKINLFFLIFFSSFIIFSSILNIPYFKPYIYRYIYNREILIDTRGAGSLKAAVSQGMTDIEKLIGKGINGKYIWGLRGWPPTPYVRQNVEIGNMQIVLTGGYLMLFVFYGLAVYAVFLGIFRSNNRLTKYLAVCVISRLIIMITAMPPRIGFEYLVFWLAIGGCLSIRLRKLNDDEVLTNYRFQKIIVKW